MLYNINEQIKISIYLFKKYYIYNIILSLKKKKEYKENYSTWCVLLLIFIILFKKFSHIAIYNTLLFYLLD